MQHQSGNLKEAEAGLKEKIEQATGDAVLDLRRFASGHNARLFLADMADGSRVVAKIAAGDRMRLALEGWMLTYLRINSSLPVPAVLHAEETLLLTEWLPDGGPFDGPVQKHAAELLAALHAIKGNEYGLERDTPIGPLYQPNKQGKDWIAFFRDQRLLHMAKEALDKNAIDLRVMAMIEKVAGKLDALLARPAAPSLIHGDVWDGNVMANKGRISGFIDPAIYYADPEIELAFATLFGTFGDAFFKRYNEINPIRAGFFEERRDIYNLYPLLVHACLYDGGGYAKNVEKIASRFI